MHASDVVIGNFYHLATELITLKVKHLTLRSRRGFFVYNCNCHYLREIIKDVLSIRDKT